MYSLWNSRLLFDINFGKITKNSSICDVFNWIITINMKKSKLIALAFLKEEIDGEVIFLLLKKDLEEIFKDYNLGNCGLFWLKIYNLQKEYNYLINNN